MSTESSDLPPWLQRLLVLGFVLLIVPFAVYGLYKAVYTSSVVLPDVQVELIDPYLEAMKAQDWAAMLAARTDAARADLTEDALVRGFEENLADLGTPVSLTLSKLNEADNVLESDRHWRATLQYEGSKGKRNLAMDLAQAQKTGGPLRIRATFRWAAGETRVPAVF